MRYAKEHKQETHARIVKKASVKLREHGAHGIGVADLMKEAGLTHGGFYAHFASREALVVEAFIYAMERSTAAWRKKTEPMPPAERFAAIVESYLSSAHRDDPGRGCALPALAAEIGRESVKTRRAFAAKLEEMVEMLAEQFPDTSTEAAREQAMAALATMVGTLVLARAGGSGKLSDDILAAGRDTLLEKPATAKARAKKPVAKGA
ncbi:TetR/AcrR family transcriptional regulator [Nitrobacteraceae bacterium UC4446_H13]